MTESGTQTPGEKRELFAERLREAGLDDTRFIDVVDGEKATHNHNQRAPDDDRLAGNYGVYAGRGAGEAGDGWLADVDVDDYDTDASSAGLDAVLDLPETFTVETPHTDGETGGHRFYAVTGDVTDAMQDVADASNPSPSWGEVRVANQYVVGPGSQLDGCEKEDCEECTTPDGGQYRIATDREIATITAEQLADALREDPAYADSDAADADDTDLSDYSPEGENDAKAVARENPWIANYLAFGVGPDGDRSAKDHAVCRTMIEHGVDKCDARELLDGSEHTKVHERGRDYWDDTWESALRKTDTSTNGGSSTPQTRNDGADGGQPEWSDLPYHNEKGNVDTRPTRQAAAEILLENHEFAAPKPQGASVTKTPLYHYWEEEGFYERSGGAWVHRHANRKVPELETSDLKEIVNRIKRESFVDRDVFDAGQFDEALINLSNGVYDLDAEKIRDHSPEYYFRTSIPQVYDPDAECPRITEFIEEIVPGEAERKTLFEWVGFCLEVGYPLHRFMILYGDGRNGKSIYFRLLKNFLESDNVTGVSLETIADGGFGVSALDRALLNVDTESADTRLGPSELNTLKALSGGDQRQVDVKFEEPFEMTNTAKLAFAANNPPRFEEETDAVADRLLTIELPYRFATDDDGDKEPIPDRRLIRELTTDDELSGLLNKALEGLQRVRERGYFSIEENASARERFEAYQADADSIMGFAHRCLKNERGFAMPKAAIYSAYKAYCNDHDHAPAEKAAFFRQLGRKTSIETHSKRPRIEVGESDGGRTNVLDHCWIETNALEYLSVPAREDIVTTIQQMHAGNGEYVHDLLLRAGATTRLRSQRSTWRRTECLKATGWRS